MRIFIIVLSFLLFACQRDNSKATEWIKPESITISCDEYFHHETSQGLLTNNVWNKHAAKNDPWKQCLEKRNIEGITQYGWSWAWPKGRKVIYSQPQIKVGSSPWAPEPKFDSSFPLEIAALKNFNISHEIEVHSNGNHNTATTMWLVREPYKGNIPKPSIIAAEIMIWTDSTKNHFDPAGSKRGEITIDGMTWGVWFQKNWEDKSGMNENQWISVSFEAENSSKKAHIPALKLLNYAILDGMLPHGLFIADVELGNEIMSGSGITWVKNFNLDYKF